MSHEGLKASGLFKTISNHSSTFCSPGKVVFGKRYKFQPLPFLRASARVIHDVNARNNLREKGAKNFTFIMCHPQP